MPESTPEGSQHVVLPSPGGTPAEEPGSPAERPSSLERKRILLLDNGQATPARGRFGPLLDNLAEDLKREAPSVVINRTTHDLVTYAEDRLDALRTEVLEGGYDGVVIAVLHAGVTAPSSLLAGQFERAGLPCVVLTTPLGGPLAGTMASYDVPGRPLVPVPELLGLDDRARAEARKETWQGVLDGLTTPGEELKARSASSDDADPAAGVRELDIEIPSDAARDALGERLLEELERLHMTDGLPVLAPTPERVEAMLGATKRSPSDVLLDGPTPSGAPITVQGLAVNAVLAGCRPEYFPVVIAAIEAMSAPEHRFFQSAITTFPGGTAVVVSGPMAQELGIASGQGCMGPGFRANATIGRAVNLAIINIARSTPGRGNLATMGSPSQYTYCFAERPDSPWPGIHEQYFDAGKTVVTVLKCESPHNVLSAIGGSARANVEATAQVAATVGTNALRWPCDHLVIVNPAQAFELSEQGWSKEDVSEYLFEHARVPIESFNADRYRDAWPVSFQSLDHIPVVESADQFIVVVAGGIGSQMMVAPPWGLSRAITREIDF